MTTLAPMLRQCGAHLVARYRLALGLIVPTALAAAAMAASPTANAHGGGYVAYPRPLYLHVPPHHARHWHYYCHRWHACNRPVIFVRAPWRPRDEPGYLHRHGHDHGHHGWHHRGHGHRGYDHRPPVYGAHWAYR